MHTGERFKGTDYHSDVEDIKAERSCQVPVSELSPEQSYDLERDSSPHRKVSKTRKTVIFPESMHLQ